MRMLAKMKDRRTIRKYTTQDISDSLLNELLEVATRASNTGNMQLYSVVVTRDQANKEKLAPAHFNQPMVKTAPVVLTFCADANRFVKWAEQRKAVPGFDNLQTFMAATIDAMLFAQCFCTAAEERGLGLCYLGTTTYNADIFPPMREFINCLIERNFSNRRVALIENGSWVPVASKKMKEKFEKSKNIDFVDSTVKILSVLSPESIGQLEKLADELCGRKGIDNE